MANKVQISAASLLVLSILVSGCSKTSDTVSTAEVKTAKSNEPVTLTFYYGQAGSYNLDKLGLTDMLKKKYPHITLNFIMRDVNAKTDYKDLIASGTLPDIIYESASFTVDRIMQNGFHYDLQELIKKNNFDLKQFEPTVLAQTQSNNSENRLYGLPASMNRYALYYNKDLFDKFGVPYPKDGMTWDDVYELTKRMTREDQGTTYMGFTTTPNNMMLNNQLSLGALDLKADKATVNTDGWKSLFENLRRFYTIPNNKLVASADITKGNIAMALEAHGNLITWPKTNPSLNLDVVSLPTMKEKPGVGLKPATVALFVSQTSKNKDAAFDVVSYLVSQEVQTVLSKQGIGTPLASDAVKKVFGQDVPEMKGKNNGAFYYYKDAPPTPPRAVELTNVAVDYAKVFADMINNNTDVNTVLRQFEESLNQAIATAKQDKAKK